MQNINKLKSLKAVVPRLEDQNNLDRNSLVKIQYFKFENELSKTSYFI